MPPKPPKRMPPKPPKKAPPMGAKASAPRREAKVFQAASWSSGEYGEKVLLYGQSGLGKTTLAATAPNPVFIGLDDGGRKIQHPVTGEDLVRIPGVESFQDVIDVLVQPGVFDDFKTIVIDTVTMMQDLAVEWLFIHVSKNDSGARATNLESYGWGKGYRHLYEAMVKILSLADHHVRAGRNVVMIAQSENARVANPEAEDFIREAPRLQKESGKTPSIADAYCEWVDHVARIGYRYVKVADRKAAGSTERAVFVLPEVWYRAKSRTITEPVISFETPADDSLWRFMFVEEE